MDQQRDNRDLVLLRGLGCRGNVMREGAGEDWKWIESRKLTNNGKKKGTKWWKGLARNQDVRTHPVMREELDLSWDDVRAEAEQKKCRPDSKTRADISEQRAMREERRWKESEKCQLMIFVRSNRAGSSQHGVRPLAADNSDKGERGGGVGLERSCRRSGKRGGSESGWGLRWRGQELERDRNGNRFRNDGTIQGRWLFSASLICVLCYMHHTQVTCWTHMYVVTVKTSHSAAVAMRRSAKESFVCLPIDFPCWQNHRMSSKERKGRRSSCACMCICLQFRFSCMPLYLHNAQRVHTDVQVLAFVTIAISVIQTASEGTHLGHHELRDQRKTICIYEQAYV